MAVTVQQTEAIPESYPDTSWPTEADAVWQRLENYVAHRWTPRAVVWIVEGEGAWQPPLTPATVSEVELWEAGAWTATTPPASPLGGYDFPGDGPYRVTATVGGGDVPAAVSEAFLRLAGYMAETDEKPGVSRYALSIGEINESYDRAPTWLARAMQNSGAGDLLRPYRRA